MTNYYILTKLSRNMKQLFILVIIFASGYLYPVSVRGQGGLYSNAKQPSSSYENTAGVNSQATQQNSTASAGLWNMNWQSNDTPGVYKAPPGGGNPPIGGVSDEPIGSGYGTLLLLGFLYIFYKVVLKFKKEEK